MIDPKVVCTALEGYRFRLTAERRVHDAIALVLDQIPVIYRREVAIDARSRLDFPLDGGTAIEVKVGGSSADLLRQVHRYAQDDRITAIIAVTTKPWHDLPATLNGKDIHLVVLNTGGL